MSYFARKESWQSQVGKLAFLAGCVPPILIGGSLMLLHVTGSVEDSHSALHVHAPSVEKFFSGSDATLATDELNLPACILLCAYNGTLAGAAVRQWRNVLVNLRFVIPTAFAGCAALTAVFFASDSPLLKPFLFSTTCFGISAALVAFD
eukprot:TRINITY_DN16748_c0_g1_i1.p1 TRINITY_DN16748_c0_g1~~TRINITY_DN16748_c0_g1_i1.p1  ORF type:complete len:149 (-),score=40.92 TRINITY_DN16748_c0_g1_i1:110-556(-)